MNERQMSLVVDLMYCMMIGQLANTDGYEEILENWEAATKMRYPREAHYPELEADIKQIKDDTINRVEMVKNIVDGYFTNEGE